MVILSLELTKEDLFQYNYYTSWAALFNSRKRVVYYLKSIAYSVGLTILLIYLLDRRISLISLIATITIAVIANFIIIPTRIKHHYEKQVDEFYANPSNSNFFLKTELVIDENGIQSRDEMTTTIHNWSAFVKKAETEGYFYLYLNSHLAILIPKRIFLSQKERTEFENMLLAHFPLRAELINLER